MKVLLFGATGMIGAGTLLECLDDPRVSHVLVLGRRPCGVTHPKIAERLVHDLAQATELPPDVAACDACLYCLGVSAAGMSESAYRAVTYDLTLHAAGLVLARAPRIVFCYISAEGADPSERGRVMWARIKGMTENALLRLPFRAAFMFRPALIQPMRGVRSRTRWYHAFYTVAGPLVSLLRRVSPRYVTTTARLGQAMIRVAADGFPRPILHTQDVNQLVAEPRRGAATAGA